MILNNSYFVNEIFIPHAKPSVTDNVTAISADLLYFIQEYETECLFKSLGFSLYKEFLSNLDETKPSYIKDGADEKWNKLLNGTEYVDSSGKPCIWKGIRRKTGETYNKSFLADYVYYHYEKSADDDRVGVGNVKQNAENAEIVNKAPKVVAAWRRFFKLVQGGCYEHTFISNNFGEGVDWIGSGEEKSLYDFIYDMNLLDNTNYQNFNPYMFTNINQFGI